MQIKVLVVDDSRFYRRRLGEILDKEVDIHVIGTAENGRDAIEKNISLTPDVITMDIEMPIMDGISAVREIMKSRPVPVLMFSSLTAEGAQATLDALDAGAVDFMLKRMEDMADHGDFSEDLCDRIRAIAKRSIPLSGLANPKYHRNIGLPAADKDGKSTPSTPRIEKINLAGCEVIAIGASTGGPAALQEIIAKLPKGFPVPVLVIQHMPAAFTGPFARRLDSISFLDVKEAADGDAIDAGKVYIAPGGRQMLIENNGGKKILRVRSSSLGEQYRPSVDVSFQSVNMAYGKNCLAIILTGMGKDGREGAAHLKKRGSSIWVQDERSCVVYGMPQAVVDAGLADRILPITEIARLLASGA
jgi:two-component system chemotaxis response regulator CheB